MSQQNTPKRFVTIAKERGVLKDRGNNADIKCLLNCTLNKKSCDFLHSFIQLSNHENKLEQSKGKSVESSVKINNKTLKDLQEKNGQHW